MREAKPLILVVDDETHILHVVRLSLNQVGCEVETAEDAERAMKLFDSHAFDAVVTDYMMPGDDGLELSAKVGRQVPVILLTGRGMDLDGELLAEHCIAEVMSKPFSPRDMGRRVLELIEANNALAPSGEVS